MWDTTERRAVGDLVTAEMIDANVDAKQWRGFAFFLPELPPRALSPNGPRGAFMAEAQARAWLRGMTAQFASLVGDLEGLAEPFARARVAVEARVYWNRRDRGMPYHARDRYRPEDVPNLVSALKPVYDGLVDAGILKGDRAGEMVLGAHEIVTVRDYAHEGLLVRIEELPLQGELPADPEQDKPHADD